VVKCELMSPEKKVLTLKVNSRNKDKSIKIVTMVYEFNPILKKVESVKVNYNEDYKLRQLIMTFNELDYSSTYHFENLKNVFVDSKGETTAKYHDYELVDNRDSAKTPAKKSK